jgi:hypothetical protein
MALTSTTGTVDGSDVTFDITSIRGASRGHGIMAYLDYTKGGSDTAALAFSFQDAGVDSTNYYSLAYVDTAAALQPTSISIDATGKYRLPVSIAQNEDVLKVTVSGLVDGDLNIEFGIDNAYA